MKRLLLFAVISLLISCNSSTNSPTDVEEQNQYYTKSIKRISDNFFVLDLLLKAEQIYPPRDSVIKALRYPFKNYPETNCWYYDSFDGIFIPYAITADAIDYYSNLIDTLAANKGAYSYSSIKQITAHFEYLAEIEFKDSYTFTGKDPYTEKPLPSISFEQVYVVNMSLKWENHCGSACAMWISHKRIVVFDKKGNLLKVFYDGRIQVPVS